MQTRAEAEAGIDDHVDERTIGRRRTEHGRRGLRRRVARRKRRLPWRPDSDPPDEYRPEVLAPAFHPVTRYGSGLHLHCPGPGERRREKRKHVFERGGTVSGRIEHEGDSPLRAPFAPAGASSKEPRTSMSSAPASSASASGTETRTQRSSPPSPAGCPAISRRRSCAVCGALPQDARRSARPRPRRRNPRAAGGVCHPEPGARSPAP